MYYDRQGNELTVDEIRAAFEAGKARLVHGYGLNHTTSALDLAGEDWDTRGQMTMMAAESWTRMPETLSDCLNAAHG